MRRSFARVTDVPPATRKVGQVRASSIFAEGSSGRTALRDVACHSSASTCAPARRMPLLDEFPAPFRGQAQLSRNGDSGLKCRARNPSFPAGRGPALHAAFAVSPRTSLAIAKRRLRSLLLLDRLQHPQLWQRYPGPARNSSSKRVRKICRKDRRIASVQAAGSPPRFSLSVDRPCQHC